jgi:hypothetical protein
MPRFGSAYRRRRRPRDAILQLVVVLGVFDLFLPRTLIALAVMSVLLYGLIIQSR